VALTVLRSRYLPTVASVNRYWADRLGKQPLEIAAREYAARLKADCARLEQERLAWIAGDDLDRLATSAAFDAVTDALPTERDTSGYAFDVMRRLPGKSADKVVWRVAGAHPVVE
jgi:hypothetical protein